MLTLRTSSAPSHRSWSALLLLVPLLIGAPCWAQTAAPAPLISPEQKADGSVTFRLRAPAADQVQLTSAGDLPEVPMRSGLPMARNADGVWELTLPNVAPGTYRYQFSLDGTPVLDPSTPRVSESNGNAWSYFHVDGNAWMDTQPVEHGAVAELTYQSSALGRARRLHVYTPPGYEQSSAALPVFYLLHGAGDSDDSWSTVGRAGFILDNLIASGQATPMIVVMPHGHTGPFSMAGGLAMEDFVREFQQDIKPFIEGRYRTLNDRAHTAIAGLSMGGAQTLEIAIADLQEYGYVGVYSSGVFGIVDSNAWETQHQAALDDAKLKDGLQLVWFAIGSDDFLLDTSKASVAMLKRHGFDVQYVETAGGHTWINWRDYLHSFAPQLFKQ